MADVFINYKREELSKALQMQGVLKVAGFSVVYDRHLVPGDRFEDWVKRELEAASAVVTLWSPLSVESEWVREEAFLAHRMGKLIPAMIAKCELPLDQMAIQYVDLTSWQGEADHPGIVSLLRAIQRRVAPSPLTPPLQTRPLKVPRETPPGPTVALDAESIGQNIEFEADREYRRNGFAWRCPVFIAHASADKPRLSPIVKILIDGGFPVWIDKPYQLDLPDKYKKKASRIAYTGDWKEQIRKAISRSKVVLGFWSTFSVNQEREQFQYELYMGLKQNKLRHCRIDVVTMEQIGRPYSFDHIADLSDFTRNQFHPVLDLLMADFKG